MPTRLEKSKTAFYRFDALTLATRSVSFDSSRDIPSLDGKVILITGGNLGLGKQSIVELARHNPLEIWLAARDVNKAKAAISEITQQVPGANIKTLQLDLASFDSVKSAAKLFLAEAKRLDIFMLNAGIMATPPGQTTDGYEIQFGTNYLGHALLARLLLPVLERTAASDPAADVRVVSIASHGHVYAPKPGGIVFETLKTDGAALGAYERYGQSKLAKILWVRELARRHPRLTVAAVHPGVVDTNLAAGVTRESLQIRVVTRAMTMLTVSPERGVRNQLWAAVSKDVKSGEYYEPVGIEGVVSSLGKDDELGAKLWEWTEEQIKDHVL